MKESYSKPQVKHRDSELSFTLLEVIVAVGLLTAVVLQVAGGQGNMLELTDYARKATEATWLAKGVMSKVEYHYNNLELEKLETATSIKDEPFNNLENTDSNEFRYSVSVKEWKFPLFEVLMNGGPAKTDEEKDAGEEDNAASPLGGVPGGNEILKQIFGDHVLKIAHVEVSWPDGARRNAVSLAYLLTNQKALDAAIVQRKPTFEGLRRKMDPNAKPNTPQTGESAPIDTTTGQSQGAGGERQPGAPVRGGSSQPSSPPQPPSDDSGPPVEVPQ